MTIEARTTPPAHRRATQVAQAEPKTVMSDLSSAEPQHTRRRAAKEPGGARREVVDLTAGDAV